MIVFILTVLVPDMVNPVRSGKLFDNLLVDLVAILDGLVADADLG